MLKLGKMQVHHVIFEKQAEDKYGYPILAKDSNGDYIIKEIRYIDLEYNERTIKNMIDYYLTKIKK
jgi:hypothetical protein